MVVVVVFIKREGAAVMPSQPKSECGDDGDVLLRDDDVVVVK